MEINNFMQLLALHLMLPHLWESANIVCLTSFVKLLLMYLQNFTVAEVFCNISASSLYSHACCMTCAIGAVYIYFQVWLMLTDRHWTFQMPEMRNCCVPAVTGSPWTLWLPQAKACEKTSKRSLCTTVLKANTHFMLRPTWPVVQWSQFNIWVTGSGRTKIFICFCVFM